MQRARTLVVASSYAEAGTPTVFLQSISTSIYADPPTDIALVQYTCPLVTPANMAVFNIGNSLMNILPVGIQANYESTFSINFNTYPQLIAPLAGQVVSNPMVADAVQDMLNDSTYGVAATFNPIYIAANSPLIFSPGSFSVTWDSTTGYTITNLDNIPIMLDFDIPSSMGILLGFGTLNELAYSVSQTSLYVPTDVSQPHAEDFVFLCSNLIRTMDDGAMIVNHGISLHNDAMFVVANGTSGYAPPQMPTISIRGSPLYQAVSTQRASGVASMVYIVYILKLASGLAINDINWNMTLSLIFKN